MITIQQLNDKWWYRLIKVIFIMLIISALAIFNYVIFSGGIKEVDLEKTVISCNLGKKIILNAGNIGLVFLDVDDFPNDKFNYRLFFNETNNFTIQEILKSCYPTNTNGDIYDKQKRAELVAKNNFIENSSSLNENQINILSVDYDRYLEETRGITGRNNKKNYLDFNFNMFDISPVFTYGKFIKLFIFGNIIILSIFEILRRILYYIFLGKIKPRK